MRRLVGRLRRRGLWLALTLPTLHGCATGATPTAATVPPRPAPVDTACVAFAPITYAKADTDQTIVQIRQYDAAWRALCGGGEGTTPP
jgi:hypothetical protein